MVKAQNGDASQIDHPEKLPTASKVVEVTATQEGYVTAIQAEEIGIAAMTIGAGRETKESVIDLSVGIVLRKKIGEQVKEGEPIADLHVNGDDAGKVSTAVDRVREAYQIASQPAEPKPLVYAIVTKNGVQRF
jgi:pyrimidine-nucleoside phosphorylase